MLDKMPKSYDLGSGELVELKYLEIVFNISRRAASRYLKALHIQPVYIGDQVLFSLPTFKRILFVLTRPGSKGFVFPGSKAKNNPRNCKNKGILIEVTGEILDQAADPKILAEMMGASGQNPDILKKFVCNPVGRPPQREKK